MNNLKKFERFDFEDLSDEDLFGKDEKVKKDSKSDLIINIKNKVEKYGGSLSMADLEADSSPVFIERRREIHLIEYLYEESVGVVPYGGYKYEDVGNEYDVEYEELDKKILKEILNLLDNAIERGYIEEDEI